MPEQDSSSAAAATADGVTPGQSQDGSVGPEGQAGAGPAEQAGAGAPALPTDVPTLQAEVLKLRAQLDESFARARETSSRLNETHERLLRSAAEFDNFKKRAVKEKDDVRKFGAENVLREFLPVADNMERALDHAEQHDPKQVIEGVRLVQKLLESSFARFGVVGFSAIGKAFDPNQHEALMQQESDQPAGTVLSEMARGYKLHERLMRPAAVVVAKPRESGAGAPTGTGEARAGANGSAPDTEGTV